MRIARTSAIRAQRCTFQRLVRAPLRLLATAATLPEQEPPHSFKVVLREYQEECIQSVLVALKAGKKRLGISLATGSGKTVIFTQLLDRVPPRKNATQTLILAHRRELVEQAAQHCINAYPDKAIDIEMGSTRATGVADITVASIQSLVAGDRLDKFDASRFKLILVDEAHHIVAQSYLRVLNHFGLKELNDDSPALVGVSATLSRPDGVKLGAALDEIVYHKDYVEMIDDKWLSDVLFTTVESKADLANVRTAKSGDFLAGSLSEAVNTEEINEITIRAWLNRAKGRQSTLVFCVDLAHVDSLTAKFRAYGIDARVITGSTKKRIRGERLDAFRNREFPVLLNCGVFTEGTDIPNVDCVLLARPTRSRNLLVQMIGRGMRLFPGKQNCHVIDMVASLESGIVTAPTLFGLDPSESVTEADIDKLRTLKEKKAEAAREQLLATTLKPPDPLSPQPRVPGKVTFTDYDSVYDLIEDTSGERHIYGLSPFAWVQVGHHRYVLNLLDKEYLTIEKDDAEEPPFKVTHAPRVSPYSHRFSRHAEEYRPHQRTRTIATANTLTDAVHAADTFGKDKCPFNFLSRTASWRGKEPTEGQLDFLNKMRSNDGKLRPHEVTKGRAMDMITKVKFGAKGRFDKMKVEKRKVERDEGKARAEEQRREDQTVRVGPIGRTSEDDLPSTREEDYATGEKRWEEVARKREEEWLFLARVPQQVAELERKRKMME